MTKQKPLLTFGTSHYNDEDGLWAVLTDLRRHNDLSRVEIVVVGNNPNTPAAKWLAKKINTWNNKGNAGCRYIAMPEPVGVAPPRNRIFAEAAGDFTLYTDCHVHLSLVAIHKFLRWIAQHPDCDDLIVGPHLRDTLHRDEYWTHLNDQWRGQQWGTWGVAWEREGGFPTTPEPGAELEPERISCINENEIAKPVWLVSQQPADIGMPDDMPWEKHQHWLIDQGYRRLGGNCDDEILVPAHGLGLFAARTASWLGFNDKFRLYGASDYYLGAKYRKAGRNVRLLGFLDWVHRYDDPNLTAASRPPRDLRFKVANVMLGLEELGIPLDRARTHFVGDKHLNDGQWDDIHTDVAGLGEPQSLGPLPRPVTPLGAGAHLKAMLKEMGIVETPTCPCNRLAAMMDSKGPEWCARPVKREFILSEMRDHSDGWGWGEKLRAGIIAVWTGKPLSLDGLYDEAVRRAAEPSP